jgi:hypothetical protein
MRTEDALREALQREAAAHPVNAALPKSTAVKARAARLLTVTGAAVLAAGLVLGGASVVGAVRDEGGPVAPASGGDHEPEARQTEGTPLLLIGHAGWRVSRADQYTSTEGEMTFTNGEREMSLTWRPAGTHGDFLEDRAAEAAETWDVEIARRHGKLFRYEGTTDFTAMWRDGELSLELRGVFPDVHAYRAVAQTLDRVDEDTWLAALPDDTVTPEERAAVVDEMLADVPVHPSVRVDDLRRSDTVSDRYQLGARVSGAVACAWIEQWVRATARGDESAAATAVDAMETSRRWAILREMESQGGWSEVVWEYADALAGDPEVMGGRPLTIEESIRDAIRSSG